jgi:hypothetical protein
MPGVRYREANMDLTSAMKARYRENDFKALLALWQNPYRYGPDQLRALTASSFSSSSATVLVHDRQSQRRRGGNTTMPARDRRATEGDSYRRCRV